MEAMTRPAGPAWLKGAEVRSDAAPDTEHRWRTIFAGLAGGRLAALDELFDLAAGDVYRLALWRTGSTDDAEDGDAAAATTSAAPFDGALGRWLIDDEFGDFSFDNASGSFAGFRVEKSLFVGGAHIPSVLRTKR